MHYRNIIIFLMHLYIIIMHNCIIFGDWMLKEHDLKLIRHLRNNSRKKITTIAKEENIPQTTLYDRLRVHQKKIIKKHTILLNFNELGYYGRVYVAVKLNDAKRREAFSSFLSNHPCINSLYKINLGYHYLFEAVFKNLSEAENFIEELEDKFSIDEKQVFSIVDEIKKEEFMTKDNKVEG
jgi:DNA-binding Lrp family transcriptional regulator